MSGGHEGDETVKRALPVAPQPSWVTDLLELVSKGMAIPGAYSEVARQCARDGLVDADGHVLAETVRDLELVYRRMFAQARPEVRQAILHPGSDAEPSALDEAYRLGQLSMAHNLVSHEYNKRPDIRFIRVMETSRYRQFLTEVLRHPIARGQVGAVMGQLGPTMDELGVATGASRLRLERIVFVLETLGIIYARGAFNGKGWEYRPSPAAVAYAGRAGFMAVTDPVAADHLRTVSS